MSGGAIMNSPWFDPALVEAVTEFVPPWLAMGLVVASLLGSIYVIGPAVLALAVRHREPVATSWPGILLAGYGSFVFLKVWLDVPRPRITSPLAGAELPFWFEPLHTVAVGFETGGWPSGHMVAGTVFYGLATVDLPTGTFRQRASLTAIILGAIGIARIGLGEHYLGDVVGGAVVGGLILLAGIWLRSHTAVPERLTLLGTVPAILAVLAGDVLYGGILVGTGATVVILQHRFL